MSSKVILISLPDKVVLWYILCCLKLKILYIYELKSYSYFFFYYCIQNVLY